MSSASGENPSQKIIEENYSQVRSDNLLESQEDNQTASEDQEDDLDPAPKQVSNEDSEVVLMHSSASVNSLRGLNLCQSNSLDLTVKTFEEENDSEPKNDEVKQSQAVSEAVQYFNQHFYDSIKENKKLLLETSLTGQENVTEACNKAFSDCKRDINKTDVRVIGKAMKDYVASLNSTKEAIETVFDDVPAVATVLELMDQSMENFEKALDNIEDNFC